MILRNLSLTVSVKVVDDGLVANPLYMKTGNESISIASEEIFDPKIYNSLKSIKHKGDSLAEKYTQNVIQKADIPVTNTITRNKFYTLQSRPPAVFLKGRKTRYTIVIRRFMCIKSRPETE